MNMEQLGRLVQQLQARINQLEQEAGVAQSIINGLGNGHGNGSGGKAKLEAPSKYGGDKDELAGFLAQMRAYLRYYPDKFGSEEAKVFFASSRLEGQALKWFEPALEDYLTKEAADRDTFTDKVFEDYASFEEEIRKVFGDADGKRHAQERLARLRQTKSATAYATQFRQNSLRADINDEGLMQLFYDGLKEEVKDELYKVDRPESLDDYIAMAIRIDDRQYARKQQRRGGQHLPAQAAYKANDKRKRQHGSTAHGTHQGPMDTSAVQHGHGLRKSNPDITCYGCGKKGHIRKDCRSSKKDWKTVPGKDVAHITKENASRVIDVAAASYTQDDLEYDMEQDDELEATMTQQSSEADLEVAMALQDLEVDMEVLRERIMARAGTSDTDPEESDEESRQDVHQFLRDTAGNEAAGTIANMVTQWGLSLTQDTEGQWRTTNSADEASGANVEHLQRQLDLYRGRCSEQQEQINGLLTDVSRYDKWVHELQDHKAELLQWDGPTEESDGAIGKDQPMLTRRCEQAYQAYSVNANNKGNIWTRVRGVDRARRMLEDMESRRIKLEEELRQMESEAATRRSSQMVGNNSEPPEGSGQHQRLRVDFRQLNQITQDLGNGFGASGRPESH
jgi:hypothetical protein